MIDLEVEATTTVIPCLTEDSWNKRKDKIAERFLSRKSKDSSERKGHSQWRHSIKAEYQIKRLFSRHGNNQGNFCSNIRNHNPKNSKSLKPNRKNSKNQNKINKSSQKINQHKSLHTWKHKLLVMELILLSKGKSMSLWVWVSQEKSVFRLCKQHLEIPKEPLSIF